ncbi:hypothetical protein ACWESM_13525 [Nocardia sp. NPDC003999]
MITGIKTSHLYAACRVRTVHHYEPGGTDNSGSATGFVVMFAPGRFALITNRHVVDLPWSDSKFDGTKLTGLVAEIWTGDVAGALERVHVILDPSGVRSHPDPSVDVAAIELVMSDMQIRDNDGALKPDTFNLTVFGGFTLDYFATEEDFASLIDVGEMLFFPGYPEWYDRNGERPIMRTGAIVSDPRYGYRRTTGPVSSKDGNHQILFDAFSTSGNSGSPVFVAQRGFVPGGDITTPNSRPHRFIGINAGHFENYGDNSSRMHHVGLSRMFKATAIADLVTRL